MANVKKRISELPALTPATLDTTYVVGISGSTTYKISINQLTSSLDNQFASDLVTNALSGTLDGKLSTSSFQSYTASISTASLVTSINNLNQFSASISTASLVTSINNLNQFTASQSTSSLVNRLNQIENVSGSWITENETGSFLTSLNGAISSSSQLTASYDERYVISGSITQTTWDNIASKPAGIVSSSTQIADLGFVTGSYAYLTEFNSLTQSFNIISGSVVNITNAVDVTQLNNTTASLNSFTASQYISNSYFATTGSNIFIGNQTITGSLRIEDDNNFSKINGFKFSLANATPNLIGNLDSVGIYAGYDIENDITTSLASNRIFYITVGESSNYWVFGRDGILNVPGNIVGAPNLATTSSVNDLSTSVDSRLDILENFSSSADNRYVLSGSITQTTWDNIASKPAGIISSSAQLTQLNNFTASVTTASLVTSITNLNEATSSYETKGRSIVSGSSQLTSSYDTRYALSSSLSSISSSFDSRFNGLVTTGSNTFSGSQVFSGSMTVTSGQVIASTITNNSSSLYLTSGSNLYVQNNGVVEITGSIILNGTTYTSLTGSVTIPSGTVSGSSQLTSSYDTRYTLSGSVQPLPSGVISGSSQLTSSYDSRYSLSGSVLTSFSQSVDSRLDNQEVFSSSLSVIANSSTKILDAFYTSATAWSGSYTGNGGTVKVEANFTMFYNTTGTRTFTLYRDGVAVDSGSFYFNQPSTHTVMPTLYYVGTNETGTHSYSVGHNASTDVNDTCNIVVTETFNTLNAGLISGSSQLTSSYDSRYVLSGSVSAVPAGTISGSAQITAFGFVSSSTSIPVGTISGSSQLTSSYDGRYVQTGSFNTLTQSFNSFTASAQSVTTGSNSFNGTQTITGSLIITTGSFIGSQIVANTSSLYLTSGSNMYVQNNGIVEITGSLNVNGVTTFARIGGDEGGEFRFGIPATNTTLQDRVTVDIFQNRFRIFEGSANAKGVYIDLSAAANGAGTNILNLNYFLEAYASVTYSLPGSYTNDTCRYSVVNTNINVSSSWFDTSTYTFTPQKAGYWHITAGYDIYRGNAEASLFIQKNSATVAIIGGIGMVTGVVTKIVYLNGSTDNIKIVNNGAAIQSRSQSSDKSFFQAKFLSE